MADTVVLFVEWLERNWMSCGLDGICFRIDSVLISNAVKCEITVALQTFITGKNTHTTE